MAAFKTKNRTLQRGFTLIELMIVVAIIGILSTVAISSYQTYMVRAQVSEGLTLAGSAKTTVTDYYLQTGEAPANRAEAGLSDNAEDTFGKYVQSIDVIDGRIQVTYGNDANTVIDNATLSLTPYEAESNQVVWRCGYDEQPVAGDGSTLDTMGSAGGGVAAAYAISTVQSRYLPEACR